MIVNFLQALVLDTSGWQVNGQAMIRWQRGTRDKENVTFLTRVQLEI